MSEERRQHPQAAPAEWGPGPDLREPQSEGGDTALPTESCLMEKAWFPHQVPRM